MMNHIEVDEFGVPLLAFGELVPRPFFEVLGRLVAVHGRIEYLRDRLAHLPSPETDGVRKVEQFLNRYSLGRMDRNNIVHSSWVFGAHTVDPEVILGVRYKVRKQASGGMATVSIRDVPGDEREQDTVQYKLEDLWKLLKHEVGTMRIGQQAYTEVMLNWARRRPLPVDTDPNTA